MAKKLSKSKKRVTRSSKNNTSVLNSIFGFPKFIIYAFVILLVLLIYQISLPSSDVKGASTTTVISGDISDAELKAKLTTASKVPDITPKFLKTRIWRDTDGDGRKDENEIVCPQKEYRYVANGTEKIKLQRSNCGWNNYDLKKDKNNKVTFTTKLKNYTYSGMEYTDKYGDIQHTKSTSITFSGGSIYYAEGGWEREVSFGLKPK